MFEVGGVPVDQAEQALLRAAHKLPIPTKVVYRDRVNSLLTGSGVRRHENVRIRALTDDQIREELAQSYKELMNLRFRTPPTS